VEKRKVVGEFCFLVASDFIFEIAF